MRLPVSACLDVLAPRSSPGHQAGAPLRLLPVPVTEVVGRASPGHQAGAPLRQPRCRMGDELGVAPSPGHQAGAPLRLPRPHVRDRPAQVLPPAIRPGLHCGPGVGIVAPDSCVTSPGHQAGAPLRHRVDGVPPSQWVHFPRPSGRGSIAASSSVNHHHRDSWLPPAIRPGLHCGTLGNVTAPGEGETFPRPSGRGSIAAWRVGRGPHGARRASPGHQAGAPLRLDEGGQRVDQVGDFPRPSGRGSIAAPGCSATRRRRRPPSPGHQARGSIAAPRRRPA